MSATLSPTFDTTFVDVSAPSILQSMRTWAIALVLVIFAGDGTFSFLIPVGMRARHLGIVDTVVIPGLAYGIVSWLILSQIKKVWTVALQMKTLMLLAVMTIFSAAWSQDPVRSLYNGVFYLLCTLFAFYLVACFPAKDIMTFIMLAGAIVCSLGLFLVIFFPRFGLSDLEIRTAGAWKGMFIDRTSAGKCLVFLLTPAFGFGFGFRQLSYRIGYAALLILSILKAQAATAVIVLACYVFFLLLLSVARRLERRTALVFGITFVSVVPIVAFFGIAFLEDFLALLGRDLTLTGRTEVWSAILPSIFQRPFFGYGFYAFWLGMTGESANVIRAAHWFFGYAHNGMIEIVLQLGFIGLFVFLLSFVQAVKDALLCYRERSIGIDWYIGLIFLALIYNIDEATVVWPTNLLSILYIVACCGLSLTARRIKAARYYMPAAYLALNP